MDSGEGGLLNVGLEALRKQLGDSELWRNAGVERSGLWGETATAWSAEKTRGKNRQKSEKERVKRERTHKELSEGGGG